MVGLIGKDKFRPVHVLMVTLCGGAVPFECWRKIMARLRQGRMVEARPETRVVIEGYVFRPRRI